MFLVITLIVALFVVNLLTLALPTATAISSNPAATCSEQTVSCSFGSVPGGATVTMYVKNSSVGSYNWNYFYACNGGGYSSLGSTNGESFNRASPRVETFRFGSDSGKFILDYHNDLQHWDQYGNLYRQFGHMTCVLGMSATYGVPNADPATAWQTATSGVTC